MIGTLGSATFVLHKFKIALVMRELIVQCLFPSKAYLRTVQYLVILSAGAFGLSACVTDRAIQSRNQDIEAWEAYEWQLERNSAAGEQPAWTVYSRKVEGSAFKEFKVEGVIRVSPAEAVRALREKTENSEAYLDEDEGFIRVLHQTSDEAWVYSVYRMPFPFRDRAMCERFVFASNAETGAWTITWQEDWEIEHPETEGVVRMPVARGSWEFTPRGDNQSRAVYIVHTEPGGSLPAWLVNGSIGKELPRELQQIEEVAAHLRQSAQQ